MDLIVNKLAANIANTGAPQRGFEELGYIFDIEGMTQTRVTPSSNIITDIVPIGAAVAYTVKICGLQPFTGTMMEGVQQLAAMLFKGTASLVVVGNTPATATIINGLACGRYVLVLVQKGVNDNSKFFALGSEIGLKLATAQFESYSEANGWVITMTEDLVINAATFVYKTSVANTQALLTGLLT